MTVDSASPNPDGPVWFVFAAEANTVGGYGMHANRWLALYATLGLALYAPDVVRAQCPENSSVIRGVPFASTLPAKNWSFNECALHGCSSGSTSYSIPLGTLNCSATASAELNTTASLTVADQFQVVGVPALEHRTARPPGALNSTRVVR